MSGHDLLLMLAPPLEIVNKLESMNLSDSSQTWRQRWIDIRADGKSDIDEVTAEVYQQALFIIEEKIKKVKVY